MEEKKMKGKEKCRILKEIRQRIADENGIEYATRECGFQGECKGTCPRCEAEVRYLEEQLERRRKSGKRVAVAALAAGLALGAVSCAGIEPLIGRGCAPSEGYYEATGAGDEDTEDEWVVLEGEVPADSMEDEWEEE